MPPANAFTVDVEDYFHVTGFADRVSPREWDSYPSRVEVGTHRLLDLLSRHGVRGTFFFLGWVADRNPGLVRNVQDAGHEIASHGYGHQLIYDQTRDEFRRDVRRSKLLLEELTGGPVTAYRAPSFSVVRRSLWALEVLAEEGFEVDSSVFPARHDRYGIADSPTEPHLRETPAGPIWEFPPTVLPLGRMNLPVAGGGYFRLLPTRATVAAFRRVNSTLNRTGMFYIHPWELDPDQPRLPGRRSARFRHYLNLHSTADKLDRLLGSLRFASVGTVLTDWRSRQAASGRFSAAVVS